MPPDDQIQLAVEAVIKAAKTGNIGDRQVFVSTIDAARRIRADAQGPEAVWESLNDG